MHGWLLRLSSRSQWLVEEGAVVEGAVVEAIESENHISCSRLSSGIFFETGEERLSR